VEALSADALSAAKSGLVSGSSCIASTGASTGARFSSCEVWASGAVEVAITGQVAGTGIAGAIVGDAAVPVGAIATAAEVVNSL
jgi:hypothetical protein